MVYKCFDKKSSGNGINLCQINNLQMDSTNQLLDKFKRSKVYSSFKSNIWGADLANMQFTSKYNKAIRFVLCVIDICSKYAWVIPLKDKKRITIVNVFQKKLNDSKRKLNKIWVDKGKEFYNRSMKSWL